MLNARPFANFAVDNQHKVNNNSSNNNNNFAINNNEHATFERVLDELDKQDQ